MIAKPEMGAECVVKSFVLLGDQNAGKSTMLHRHLAQIGALKKHAKEPPMFIFLGKFSIVNWGSFSFLKSGDINNKRPQCLISP